MKNKSLIVTITVVTALSLGILTGCGAVQHANADPLTNPTQIEQTIEIEDETETQESTESTQESSKDTQETSTEQQELQNQDADPTEETHNDNGKPNTETTDSKPSTEQAHTHTWVTETRYRTVHHDAVYENQTIIDQAAWDETVTTYTTETQVIHHDAITHTVHHEGGWHGRCCDCGAEFDSWEAAEAHLEAADHTGYTGRSTDGWDEEIVDQPAWDETVEVQVPHTTTVHHDAVTHVEKVMVKDAYDEQVPYTVTVCSECGKEK